MLVSQGDWGGLAQRLVLRPFHRRGEGCSIMDKAVKKDEGKNAQDGDKRRKQH
jgi:hypothetical protein